MLVSNVAIGLCHVFRQQQTVFCPPGFAQLLECFRADHLAQRIRRVDSAIDQDMGHVNIARCILGIQALTQHTAPAHGSRVGVLSGIAANGRCR